MNEKQIFSSFGGMAKGRGGWPDVLICALFLFALLSSCKHNGQANLTVMQNGRTAIPHNQQFDTVYNDLMKEKIAVFTSGGAVKQADLDCSSLPDITDMDIAKWLPRKRLGIMADKELQHLTPFQQKYYEKLMQLIRGKSLSLSRLLVRIAKLETEIVENSPTTEEAAQLLQITSVARQSAQYWVKNINKWMMLNSEIMGVLKEWPVAQPDQKTPSSNIGGV
jgi:hypothetical protein